ncbi:MAG: hypothetical protein ABIP94_22725 [Planctomycetota bacterium]
MNDRRTEDWEDRFVDAALQELHGSKPPDLSARVVLAMQSTQHSSAGATNGDLPTLLPKRRHKGSTLPWLALVAAAMLLVGTLVVTWLQRPATWREQVVVQLEVHVFEGELESVQFARREHQRGDRQAVDPTTGALTTSELTTGELATGEPATGELATGAFGVGLPRVERHTAGASATFRARPGNRLRTASSCTAQIGPFGVLAAGPDTDLEVHSMELTWKHGVVAASTLTLAVVAGTATWYTLSHTETASAGEMLRLEADSDGARGAAALAAENARLRQRVQELQQHNETMEAQASRTPAPMRPPEATSPPTPAEPAVAPPKTAAFTDPKFDEALASVDWSVIGNVTNEMGPKLAELVAAMTKDGAEMPMDLALKVGELNAQLVKQLMGMPEPGLPGFGPNGTYTHPLMVANSLASTLEAAGQPLSDDQRATIGGLVRSFSAENQAIVDGSREFELEQLLAETEMKDRFYREVDTLLAPGQHGTAFPEGAGDHEGSSLFGTGTLTRPYGSPILAHDAAEFARIASNRLSEHIGFDEATAAKVRAVLERAVAAPELWQHPTEPVETSALHMLRSGRTTTALRRQLEWMREIQRQVPLTPEQRKKLAAMKQVLVPLPR